MLTVAKVQDGRVLLSTGFVAALVSILAVIGPLVTAIAGAVLQPREQEATLADLHRRTTFDMLRVALTSPEPIQRQSSLRFLISTGLLEDNTGALQRLEGEHIPQWPMPAAPTPSASQQGGSVKPIQ